MLGFAFRGETFCDGLLPYLTSLVNVSGDLLEALLYLRDRVVLDEPRHTAKRVCFHLYIEGFIYEVEVCAAVQGICKLCTSLRSADMCSFVTMKLLWQP